MASNSKDTRLQPSGFAWFVAIQLVASAVDFALLPASNDGPNFWIAPSLAFVFFFLVPLRHWPVLGALYLATHGATSMVFPCDPWLVAGWSLAGLVESILAAALMRSRPVPTGPISLGHLSVALAIFSFLAIPAGAAIGAGFQWWRSDLEWQPLFWHGWRAGFSGTLFVLLPFLVRDGSVFDKIRQTPLLHAGWSIFLGILAAGILAWIPFPFPYLALPLGLAAFHFGALRVSLMGGSTFLVCAFLFKVGWIQPPAAYSWAGSDGLFTSGLVTYLSTVLIGMLADRIRHHQALAIETEQRLRDALTLSGTGYAIVNLDFTIREANPYLCQMMGSTEEQLVGRSIQLATLDKDKEAAASRLAKVLEGETTSYCVDRELVRLDGSVVWARVTVAKPASFKDGFFLQVHDMSADHLAKLALEDAKAAADQAVRVKTEFVTNMSHEIRTPLNGIIGLSEILARSELSNESWDLAQMIRRSAKALAGVIHSILDYSRLESGRIELEFSEFDLDELASTISGIMAASSAQKRLDLAISVDPDVPRRLRGDSLRLQQVLVNLVGNAVKFTEQGEVHVRIERAPGDAGRFRFSVQDSGIGMDPSLASRIFVPFTQLDSSITRRHDGAGLGLAISRRLVELMEGRLEFETCPGVGTEFRFSVPLQEIPGIPIQIEASPRHPFLVVESNPTLASSMERAFRRLGWPCQILSSIPHLRGLLKRSEHSGEFWTGIVVDANLAGLDQLRDDARTHGIPIVVVDSAYNPSETSPIDSFSIHRVLLRPVTESALRAILVPLFDEASRRTSVQPVSASETIRVLVVEDNTINQAVAVGILKKLGIHSVVTENGLEAVNLLRDDPHFDLVLMDIQMPVMDGFTATRVIHKDLELTLPIVAMTAGVLPRDRDRCAENGLDDFLAKPFDFEDMVEILERNLNRKLR